MGTAKTKKVVATKILLQKFVVLPIVDFILRVT